MTKSLSTFEPKKGFFISTESVILIFLTGILFLFGYLQETPNFEFGNLVTYLSIIWVLYLTGFMISTFFLHEHENGKFIGKIKLDNNSIIINETSYLTEEISKISIHSFDVKGQFVGYAFEFSRKLSNGLNNEITLKLRNGKEIKCHFLQTKRERMKYFKDCLINYHLKGKMSWLHLLSILELEDYDEIQKLKKEIN
jgi:hypothetical protein